MKIVLVFPLGDPRYGLPRYPPLGLCYIGAALKSQKHEVRGVDMRFNSFSKQYLLKTITDFKPDLIAMSSVTASFSNSIEIANFIKKNHQNTPIVLGGPHAAINPKEAIQHNEFDYIIKQEGEESIKDLVNALENKKDLSSVQGLLYKKNDQIIENETTKLVDDIDTLDNPDFNIFLIEEYKSRGKLVLPILTSRGCPFNCVYCSSHKTHGKKFRARDPIKVVDEIENLMHKFNCKNFSIIDDLFSLDIPRAETICNEILKRNLNIKWSCDQGIKADCVTPEFFKKMKQSGCTMIALGVESANPEILKNLNRSSLEKTKQAIMWAKQAGLIVKAFFIVNCPGETPETVKENIKFFKEYDIDIPRFGLMIPYPNTPMWAWVHENANILVDLNKFITEARPDDEAIVFETKQFNKDQIIKSFKLAETETEKWIIKKALTNKFGNSFGQILYAPFLLKPLRELVKLAYKLKIISTADL